MKSVVFPVAVQATVFLGGHRRYFSKAAALRGYAKARYDAKHAGECECESGFVDPGTGYYPPNCNMHERRDLVVSRYVRWIKRVSRKGQ